jgi:mannose/fructose-specific phosphotransferase system component IIA
MRCGSARCMCSPIASRHIVALDVLPNVSPEETLAAARITLEQQLRAPRSQVLVLADVFGATPCNVAQKLVDGARSRLVAGVNLPMLLRASATGTSRSSAGAAGRRGRHRGCHAGGGHGSPEPGEEKAQ